MIAVVASRDLWPTPEVVAAVAAAVGSHGEPVAIRASTKSVIASHVEEAAVKLCDLFSVELRPYKPEGPGREAVFERDYRLVENSSKVYAFFAPGEEMQGGTGHVVKAALDRGVDVEAFGLDEQGNVVLLGSEEGT